MQIVCGVRDGVTVELRAASVNTVPRKIKNTFVRALWGQNFELDPLLDELFLI